MNTKTNLTERTVVIIVALMLTCLLCCLGVRAQGMIWESGVQRAANRVEATPTIDGLAEYITAEIQVGMSRDKVEQVLQEMTPIEVTLRHPLEDVGSGYGPTSCDEIRLKVTSFPGHVWKITACYDIQGRLVLLRSDNIERFPGVSIFADPTQEGELFKSP